MKLTAKQTTLLFVLVIVAVGIWAWYPVLNFWFLKAFEPSWLHDALPYTLTRLIRTHAFLYYLDLKLFGWQAWGWYLTSLVLHVVASVLLFQVAVKLTRNQLIGFVAGLIFVANTAYNDVLTWGSFNSYYPLLLILMLGSFSQFVSYRETGKPRHLYLAVLFGLLGFFTRETGILIVPLLTLYDIVTAGDLRKKATWLGILKRQWPLYAALAVFFVLRSSYGGTIGDTVDSNVKMQQRLLHDKLYREYARVTTLTFGKLIPPMLIPYPLLNDWRDAQIASGNSEWLRVYYFPIVGFIGYGILGLVPLLFRRHKLARLLLYFWLWAGLFSLFIALAIPQVQEVMIRPYEVITMRYRYFAFAGLSIFFAILLVAVTDWFQRLIVQLPRSIILSTVLVVLVGVNLHYLRQIEKEMYESTYKTGKEFHQEFKKQFPSLPTNAAFYIFPHAHGLNDHLFEWYFIKDIAYPNLKGQPYRIESQIEAVIEKISRNKLALSDVFFLDYHPATGLANRTKDVVAEIKKQTVYRLPAKKQNETTYQTDTVEGPPVELPYNLSLKLTTNYQPIIAPGISPDSQRFRSLANYAIERKNYLDTVTLTSSRTMSQRDEEPFYYYAPGNLIDGNTGRRSSWIADAIPGWFAASLPEAQTIHAVAWGTLDGSPRTPATYSYYSSDDSQSWQLVKTVKNNTKFSVVDRFDRPVKTKHLKMVIDTTGTGDFVQVDEFELIGERGQAVLAHYTDRNALLEDSRNLYRFLASADDLMYARNQGLNFHWAKLSWGTDQFSHDVNSQFVYFVYSITGQSQTVTVKIPEREIYSDVGQLLTKHLTSLNLDLGNVPLASSIQNLELVPRYQLNLSP